MRSALLFMFLGLVFLPRAAAAGEVGRKGKIQGESWVNLRSGPGVSHEPITVLRKGQEFYVVREERGWYRVSLPEGREGYVDKRFVLLLGREERPKAPPKATQEEVAVEPDQELERDAEVSSPPQGERQLLRGGRRPLIVLLEMKKWDILWWLAVFACLFILGWICGGNYYLRRDRARGGKLRF